MKNLLVFFLPVMFIASFYSCKEADSTAKKDEKHTDTVVTTNTAKDTALTIADAATILAKKEVPILCYHQVRDWKASDSKMARDYIVPTQLFKSHMKILADSGYHTILPNQLYAYLTTGAPLPEKPVMLTFDDTDIDQYETAWPEMKKYGFKGVFFIMTVSVNRKPRYMSTEQIRELSDAGNVVASHTWNHERVPSYTTEEKWVEQIEKPNKKIEEIIGKKPEPYFAYPFGLWNKAAIPELKKRGIKAAFILSTKRDEDEPLFTIRRIIASGKWTTEGFYKSMVSSFH